MLSLRPYQEDALAAIDQAVQRGVRRQIICLPTGTGKTVLFAEYIRRRLPERALILVHRDELLQQAAEKLLKMAPDLQPGIVKGPQDQCHARVVIASVQTISRPNRLQRLAADFGTVVIDEAHHAAAETYRRVLEHVGAFTPTGPVVVGVTATPYRADRVGLVGEEMFEAVVYERGLLEMIRAGYLANLRAKHVQLAVDFNTLRVRSGDYALDEVAEALTAADAPRHVADSIAEHAGNRKTLVFAPSVQLAQDIALAVAARGLSAEAIHGEMPIERRRAVLGRLRSGETQVVSNCAVLTEGFDEPSVSCIAIARPTRSKSLYVQMIGRGTRKHPGKTECLILDVVGATAAHDLMTVGSLFGLSPAALEHQSVVKADAERRGQEEAAALVGRLVAKTVELFERRDFQWITVTPQHFALSAGKAGTIHLKEEPRGWTAYVVAAEGGRTVLACEAAVELAQGIAEDYVRGKGAAVLVSRTAPWREAPATEKQLATLRKWKLRPAPGLTRGEASDLIAARVAKRAG